MSLHLDVRRAVKAALDEGYRLIDTAHIYGNEAEIGEALQEYLESGKLNRSDIFLSTKLWVRSFKNVLGFKYIIQGKFFNFVGSVDFFNCINLVYGWN